MSSVFNLPIVFILEDNGLAIHTKKQSRTSLKKYSDLSRSFNIKTFSGTFKNPFDLYKSFQEAYNFSRDKRMPSFIEIECFRWVEHVGINFDWDLGYRSKSELEEWKKYDIIESPNIISMDKEFVNKKSAFYKSMFQKMFEKCSKYSDPEKSDLLKNVF